MYESLQEHIIIAMNRLGMIAVMCGDGTNDVGALKRAHVGISIVKHPETEQLQRFVFGSKLDNKFNTVEVNGESTNWVAPCVRRFNGII